VGNRKSLAIVVKLIEFLKSLPFKEIVNSENTSFPIMCACLTSPFLLCRACCVGKCVYDTIFAKNEVKLNKNVYVIHDEY
jgi:hypothetical protein